MTLNSYESSKHYKPKVKTYHDKKILHKEFRPGQQVLLCNSNLKVFPEKLKSKWYGPFIVKEVNLYGAIVLEDPTSKRNWVLNGQRLKLYLGGEVEKVTTIMLLNNP